MKKFLSTLVVGVFTSLSAMAADNIAGVYKTIDDETGEAKSLVQIYAHQGKMYGRIVKLFENQGATAVGIKGDPKILGLDIIWGLQDEGKRYEGGHILDPTKGKIYRCEMWREGNKLIVRGKIGPFGRNQTWIFESSGKNETFVPSIPVRK